MNQDTPSLVGFRDRCGQFWAVFADGVRVDIIGARESGRWSTLRPIRPSNGNGQVDGGRVAHPLAGGYQRVALARFFSGTPHRLRVDFDGDMVAELATS